MCWKWEIHFLGVVLMRKKIQYNTKYKMWIAKPMSLITNSLILVSNPQHKENISTQKRPTPSGTRTHDLSAARLTAFATTFSSLLYLYKSAMSVFRLRPGFLVSGLHLVSLSSNLCRSLLNEALWNIQTFSSTNVRAAPPRAAQPSVSALFDSSLDPDAFD